MTDDMRVHSPLGAYPTLTYSATLSSRHAVNARGLVVLVQDTVIRFP